MIALKRRRKSPYHSGPLTVCLLLAAFCSAPALAESQQEILFFPSIEHMVDNATYTSVYPRVSLAPEQRFVSKGGKIARSDEENPDNLVTVVDWFVPGS